MKLPKSIKFSGVRLDKTRPESGVRFDLAHKRFARHWRCVHVDCRVCGLLHSFAAIIRVHIHRNFKRPIFLFLQRDGDDMLSQFCKTCTQFCARHNEILQRALLPRNFSKLLRLRVILRSLRFEFGTRWREAVIAFINMYVQFPRMI